MDRLVGEVTQAFGRLDVLINDAAYNVSIPFGDLDNLTMDEWNRIMAVNLTGPMRLTKAHHQHSFGSRAQPDRFFYRLCRVEGGAHSSDALHGGGAGA